MKLLLLLSLVLLSFNSIAQYSSANQDTAADPDAAFSGQTGYVNTTQADLEDDETVEEQEDDEGDAEMDVADDNQDESDSE